MVIKKLEFDARVIKSAAKLCLHAIDASNNFYRARQLERGDFVGTVIHAREYIDDRNRRHFEVVLEKEVTLRGKTYTYEGKMVGREFYESFQDSGARIGDKIKAHVTKKVEYSLSDPTTCIATHHKWNVEVIKREQQRAGHGDSGQKKAKEVVRSI
jgi:hypothetical protein